MTYDKQALLEAVQLLVEDTDAPRRVTVLEDVARLSRQYPIRLTGDYSALQPVLGRGGRGTG